MGPIQVFIILVLVQVSNTARLEYEETATPVIFTQFDLDPGDKSDSIYQKEVRKGLLGLVDCIDDTQLQIITIDRVPPASLLVQYNITFSYTEAMVSKVADVFYDIIYNNKSTSMFDQKAMVELVQIENLDVEFNTPPTRCEIFDELYECANGCGEINETAQCNSTSDSQDIVVHFEEHREKRNAVNNEVSQEETTDESSQSSESSQESSQSSEESSQGSSQSSESSQESSQSSEESSQESSAEQASADMQIVFDYSIDPEADLSDPTVQQNYQNEFETQLTVLFREEMGDNLEEVNVTNVGRGSAIVDLTITYRNNEAAASGLTGSVEKVAKNASIEIFNEPVYPIGLTVGSNQFPIDEEGPDKCLIFNTVTTCPSGSECTVINDEAVCSGSSQSSEESSQSSEESSQGSSESSESSQDSSQSTEESSQGSSESSESSQESSQSSEESSQGSSESSESSQGSSQSSEESSQGSSESSESSQESSQSSEESSQASSESSESSQESSQSSEESSQASSESSESSQESSQSSEESSQASSESSQSSQESSQSSEESSQASSESSESIQESSQSSEESSQASSESSESIQESSQSSEESSQASSESSESSQESSQSSEESSQETSGQQQTDMQIVLSYESGQNDDLSDPVVNQNYKNEADNQLTGFLRPEMGDSLIDVIIKNVRQGSVIVNFTVVYADTAAGRSGITNAIVKIAQNNSISFFNETVYPESFTVDQTAVSIDEKTSNCQIFNLLTNCGAGFECSVFNGTAYCKPIAATDDEDKGNLGLVVGLSVGGVCLLIALALFAFVLYFRVKPKKYDWKNDSFDSSVDQVFSGGMAPRYNSRRMVDPTYGMDNRREELPTERAGVHVHTPRNYVEQRGGKPHWERFDDDRPVRSNFSWDFLYNYLGDKEKYAIRRPKVEKIYDNN